MEELKNLLMLDSSEYDSKLDTLFSTELIESIEPLLITKILAFETNHEDAVKYILRILKLFTKENKIYSAEICRVLKIFIIENINESHSKVLFDNLLSYTNRYYLTIIFDSMEKREFRKFLENLKLPKESRYELVNITSKSKKASKLLISSTIGKLFESDINYLSYLFKTDDFDIDDNGYLESIANFIESPAFPKSKYLKNNLRNKFIEFLFDVIHKNRYYATASSYEFNYGKIASFKFVGFTYKIVLEIFNRIDKTKIFNIETRDFNNTLRKDYLWSDYDNFETKVYLTALYGLRVCYNGLVLLNNSFKRASENNFMTFLLGMQINNFSEKIKAIEKIINNNTIKSVTEELLNYYINDFLQINSEIVDSVIQYYFDISKIKPEYKFTDIVLNYFYKLLATKSDYCNVHYKFDILGLLCTIFSKTKIPNNTKLLEAIILYHDEHDMFKTENKESAHALYKLSLMMLGNILSTHTNLSEINNQQLFLKFFYRTNSHILSFLDDLTRIFDSVSDELSTYLIRAQYSIQVRVIVDNIKLSLNIGNIILERQLLEPEIFRGEIILPIITLSTSIIKYFTSGRNPIYTVFEMNFEALDIMKYSLKILHKLINNVEFTELIQPSKLEILEALPYIKFEESESYVKLELKEILEKEISSTKIEEVPEEFCDPLLCTVIKEPVMIPNVELIFDKSSILSQIYHEKINPYTREPLDEVILNEHNKSDHVKTRINEFIDKYNKWKNN